MATRDRFYVYEHWRLDKDECFYVGKGTGSRAYSRSNRNTHWRNIVAKLERLGSGYEIRLVATGLSEEASFLLEVQRILFWKDLVDLSNQTDGGEGISGFTHSEETRKTLSGLNKGKPAAFKGRNHTEKTKKLLSELGKARGAPNLTEEQKIKAANFHRGKKRSPETCAKIAEKAKGRRSPNKGKTSPLKGTHLSDEVKAKMSLAKKEWWTRKKQEVH